MSYATLFVRACLCFGFAGILSISRAAEPEPFDENEVYLASRPSILPDGKSFVFEWCDSLWQASTEGGVASLVQKSQGNDVWPVVSPDGTKLAFTSNRNGYSQVFVAAIGENTVAQPVTFHSEGARPYFWSTDSKQILCYVWRDFDGGPFGCGRLVWIDVTQRVAERVVFDANAIDPSLSPDGKLLLFTREGSDTIYRKGERTECASQIWLYNLETKNFTQLVKNPTESLSPVWRPDGEGFYYVTGEDGTHNLWYYEMASGATRQITHFKGDSVIAPTLSADGRTMIFRQGFYFYRLDPTVEPAKPVRIKITPSHIGSGRPKMKRRYYTNLWNNDGPGDLAECDKGLQFAFTTGGDLFVMDTVLREPRLVHGNSLTHERECVFSKDGDTLFFLSDRDTGTALLKANRHVPERFWWENQNFDITPILPGTFTRERLRLSPDGKRLSWVEPGYKIVIADLEGRTISETPLVPAISSYNWSPDSQWLAVTMADEYDNYDVWIVSVEGKVPPYNVSRHFSWDANPVWSPDGKLLAFSGVRPESGHTLFYVWLNKEDEDALKEKDYEDAVRKMGRPTGPKPADPKPAPHTPDEQKMTHGADAQPNKATALDPKANAARAVAFMSGKVPGESDPSAPATKDLDKTPTTNAAPALTVKITFDDLHQRVRMVEGARDPGAPFFCYDSRRLIFPATVGGKAGTYEVTIPSNMRPRLMFDTWGYPIAWYNRPEDRLVWVTSNREIAWGRTRFPFKVHQETDIEDYQELGFLTAWTMLNENFYDRNFHGANWDAIREKYRLAARHAPSYSVFSRIMHMLNGELNASHTGFYPSDRSRAEWQPTLNTQNWNPVTAHLGLRFDLNDNGPGWLIRDVLKNGPADRREINLHPGDRILAVNRTQVGPTTDPTLVLNGTQNQKFLLDVQSGADSNATRTIIIEAITFAQARDLLREEAAEATRETVHAKSNGRFGYIEIRKMNDAEYYKFEHEIFAEGFDKEGLIIDVRNNTGGFTTDRLLDIISVARHSVSATRYGTPAYLASYWNRPVFSKPIVVLCSQRTFSNGEIFCHAIRELKRGRIVGVQTGGGVIATRDMSLLDLGTIRSPRYGWFCMDGTDMEWNGAKPDIVVWNTPADNVAGRDRQLETAITALEEDVDTWKKNTKTFTPNYVTWPHQL